MDKYVFKKLIIEPILFYKTIYEHGYIFNKNIENYFIDNKKYNLDKDTIKNINRLIDIFSVDNINIKPFIVILLSVDNLNLKNISRHILVKWNIYKQLDKRFQKKKINLKLSELTLYYFLDNIDKFINSNKSMKNNLIYFVLNSIENYFYLF